MNEVMTQLIERAAVDQLHSAEVVEITESDTIIVTKDGDATPLRCELLVTTEGLAPLLVPGDRVLVWVSAGSNPAVVIGRIGPSRGASAEPPTPETVTLEAKQSLTLRVGNGSITMREDGKILIKGKDLVSHAERMNRIKGGAVSIN
jgi:hypothetical protein